MTVRGRRATSYSATFGAIVAVDNRRWAACPAAEYAHFYGWNLGSLVVPQLHQQGEQPLVLTLYANSSGGCDPSSAEPPTPTFDQHVESSKW
jgi:hypothetical protein